MSLILPRSVLMTAAVAVLAVAGCESSDGATVKVHSQAQTSQGQTLAQADLSPALAQPAGLDTAVNVAAEDRLTKLEAAIAQLQADMQMHQAQFSRLTTIEDQLSTLLAEVKGLRVTPAMRSEPVPALKKEQTQKDDAPVAPVKPPPPPAPEPAAKVVAKSVPLPEVKPSLNKDQETQVAAPPSVPEAKPRADLSTEAPKAGSPAPDYKPASATMPSAPTVTSVRVGEHPSKTRMVFEASAPITFTTDVDNTEKILLLSIKGMAWTAARERALSGSPFVLAYTAQDDGVGGQRVVMTLKQKTAVNAYTINAEGGQPNRLVLDLVSAP